MIQTCPDQEDLTNPYDAYSDQSVDEDCGNDDSADVVVLERLKEEEEAAKLKRENKQ